MNEFDAVKFADGIAALTNLGFTVVGAHLKYRVSDDEWVVVFVAESGEELNNQLALNAASALQDLGYVSRGWGHRYDPVNSVMSYRFWSDQNGSPPRPE